MTEDRAEHLLKRAGELEEMAREADDSSVRIQLLNIADTYRRRAVQDLKLRNTQRDPK